MMDNRIKWIIYKYKEDININDDLFKHIL